MIFLKDYIQESLLDDFEDLANAQDAVLMHPFTWLHEQSLKCKDWNQLYKVLKEFHSIISMKEYSTEIDRKTYSNDNTEYHFWTIQSRKLNKNDLLCRFNFNINDPGISLYKYDLLYIGFSKSMGLALNIDRQNISWRIINSKMILQDMSDNVDEMYRIKPNSSFYKEYDAMAKELGIK